VSHNGYAGKPVPSRQATPEEMDGLVSVMGEMKRGLMQITIGREFSTRHMAEVSRKYGVPVTWTALLSHLYGPGGHRKQLDLAAEQRKSGALVIPQVSCRPLNFEFTFAEPFIFDVMKFMNELSVEDAKAPGTRRRAYADPAWRDRAREAWKNTKGIRPRWDAMEVMETSRPELAGANLGRLASERGVDPFDLLLDITLGEPDLAVRIKAMLANDDAAGVELLLQEDHCTLGLSDAGAHVGQLCDAVLPTDLLGIWVRDRQVLTMENAIHKLTQQQAEIFGFTDRGVLRAGAHADVVVFDPETVAPGPLRRVADFPAGAERLTADQPTGMRHLMVNGQWVQRDGAFSDASRAERPGVLVKPGRP
jgi:N-acyl-D-aspartate/D-glutamate deacylase